MARATIVLACLGVLLGGCAGTAAPGEQVSSADGSAPAFAPPPTLEGSVSTKISPHARDLLARARRENQLVVTLVVSAVPGGTEEAAAGLKGLGATVANSDPAIGYLRATVSTTVVERVVMLPSVSAVDIDEVIVRDDPTP